MRFSLILCMVAVLSVAVAHGAENSTPNPKVELETSRGKIILELFPDKAPRTVENFLSYVDSGFYQGTIFHRVIEQFMIQGGDPLGNGTGGAGYYLNAELSDLTHQMGTLAMARGRDPNSASTQFYVCLARNAVTKRLDGQYTIFGHLIKGYDVLHKIGSVECVANPLNPSEISKPRESVYVRTIYVSDAEGNEII